MTFKQASGNQQSRTERTAVHGRGNQRIDPSAFEVSGDLRELAEKRGAIIAAKSETEVALAKVKALMMRAAAVRNTSGSFVPRTTWMRWKAEQTRLVGELQQLVLTLSELNLKIAAKRGLSEHTKQLSFEAAFHRAAKLLLAGPVLDKITAAALHMLTDHLDQEIQP